jgi:transposase
MENARRVPISPGRPALPVTLTLGERTALQRWGRRPKSAGPLGQRARIVLASAAGQTNEAIAVAVGVTRQTVGRWRRRFANRGLEGLADAPRPGAPRRISDAKIGHTVRLILAAARNELARRSTRALARRSGLSQTSISRIWRALRRHPRRSGEAAQRARSRRPLRRRLRSRSPSR